MPEQNKKNEPVLSRRGIECHLCIKCDHLHGLAVRSEHYVPSGNALWQAQGRGEEKKQRRRKEKQTLSLTVCPDVPGKWPTPSEPTRHPSACQCRAASSGPMGPCEQILPIWWRGRTNTQTHKHTKHVQKQMCEQTNSDALSSSSWLDFFFSENVIGWIQIRIKTQANALKNNGGRFTPLHLWRWASAALSRRNWWVDCYTINSFYITTEG